MTIYKKYEFENYDAYTKAQIHRAKPSRSRTFRYHSLRKYAIEEIKKHIPDARSILSIGSRSDTEVQELRDAGFEADGIDLISGNLIHKGDATRLFKHDYFKNKEYDIFISIHSLEHIWDIERFKSESLKKCKKAFIHLGPPVGADDKPGLWDCVILDFQENKITDEVRKDRLQKFFPDFTPIEAKIIKIRVRVVYFLLNRK